MTSSNETLSTIPDQHILAAQNHAARRVMQASGIEYDGQTIDGKLDPPVAAAKRLAMLGKISNQGIKELISAGIIDS